MEQKKITDYPSIDKPWMKYYSEESIRTMYKQTDIRGEVVSGT